MKEPGTVAPGLESATLRARYEVLALLGFGHSPALTQDVERSAQVAIDDDPRHASTSAGWPQRKTLLSCGRRRSVLSHSESPSEHIRAPIGVPFVCSLSGAVFVFCVRGVFA